MDSFGGLGEVLMRCRVINESVELVGVDADCLTSGFSAKASNGFLGVSGA